MIWFSRDNEELMTRKIRYKSVYELRLSVDMSLVYAALFYYYVTLLARFDAR